MRVSFDRICVPTDFSPAADHAVHFAAGLAHCHDASLHLLHVIEHAGPLVHHPDFTGDGEVARAYFNRLERAVANVEEKLKAEGDDKWHDVPDLIKSLESGAVEKIESVGDQWWAGLEVHRDIRYGHAVKEINHYVEKLEIDLLVLGTHGHSRLASVLLGSVTERVVRTCACPVTVVRHPEHEYKIVD
ncbi:MAG: universal stress protein [Pirellulaceae bacterium]|nr:universal stress protein [Pirellulaceae bacterium]